MKKLKISFCAFYHIQIFILVIFHIETTLFQTQLVDFCLCYSKHTCIYTQKHTVNR